MDKGRDGGRDFGRMTTGLVLHVSFCHPDRYHGVVGRRTVVLFAGFQTLLVDSFQGF